MNKVKIIYSKNSKNILSNMRLLFDDFVDVKIQVNNKTYSIKPFGKFEIIKNYKIVKSDIVHDINIPNAFVYNKADRFLQRQLNKKFDYFGSTLGQYLGLGYQSKHKWFDSEIVTKYLQYCLFDDIMEYNASKMSIKDLFNVTSGIVKVQSERTENVIKHKPNISKKISELKDKVVNRRQEN